MSEQLPVGGYVARIERVEKKISKTGSPYLQLTLDVAEGPYTGWYRKDLQSRMGGRYEARHKGTYTLFYPLDDGPRRDGWTHDTFTRFQDFLRKSNDGFSWGASDDPQALVGKIIGIVVREVEWNGYVFNRIGKFVSAGAIRTNNYKLMERKKERSTAQPSSPIPAPQTPDIPLGFTVVENPPDLPF